MVKTEPWNQINLKHFSADHCVWTKVKPLSRFSCNIEKMRNQSRHFGTSFPPTRPPRIEMVCLRSNTRGWCPLRLHGDNDMSSLLITKEANYIKRSRTEGWTCFICFCRHSSKLSHWEAWDCCTHVAFSLSLKRRKITSGLSSVVTRTTLAWHQLHFSNYSC